MKPLQRRTKLPAGSYWIVGINRCGRLVVILDVTVPAGSVVEEYLTRAALEDWREYRRHVAVFTPAAVLGVMLLVGAAGVLVWVLTGSASLLPDTAERPDAAGSSAPHMPRETGSHPPSGSPGSALARSHGMSRVPAASSSSPSPVSVVPVERTSGSPLVSVAVPRSHPVRHVRRVLPSPVSTVRPCELLGLPVGHCRR